MMESTKTVRLEDRIEELEQEITDIEDRQEEIVRKSVEAEQRGEEIDSDLEDEFDELEADRVEKDGEMQTMERTVNNWGSGEFEIKEMTFGQVQKISDDVLDKSFDIDMQTQDMSGTPKEGYYQIAVLREAIEESPNSAPSDPADYPTTVGEYLFEKVNALNTVGDTEMGNSSLEDRMEKYKDSTQSSSTEE